VYVEVTALTEAVTVAGTGWDAVVTEVVEEATTVVGRAAVSVQLVVTAEVIVPTVVTVTRYEYWSILPTF